MHASCFSDLTKLNPAIRFWWSTFARSIVTSSIVPSTFAGSWNIFFSYFSILVFWQLSPSFCFLTFSESLHWVVEAFLSEGKLSRSGFRCGDGWIQTKTKDNVNRQVQSPKLLSRHLMIWIWPFPFIIIHMTKKFGNFRRLIDRWCVQVSLHLTTKIQMFEFS